MLNTTDSLALDYFFSPFVKKAMMESPKLQAELLPRVFSVMENATLQIGSNKPTTLLIEDKALVSVGCGDLKKCFIKSSCKGLGRSGKELKVPDADVFMHLELVDVDGIITLKTGFYTKEEVLELIS